MSEINRLMDLLVKEKTIKRIAETLGNSPATVLKWCTNTAQPSFETFIEIVRILDIELKELFVKDVLNIKEYNNKTN